jgi:hypothetical protein
VVSALPGMTKRELDNEHGDGFQASVEVFYQHVAAQTYAYSVDLDFITLEQIPYLSAAVG